ncbi:MAG TPA: SGNH/GDSL hydrolase family protein [Acetobacteraceae bacterium]|nr:SGNH/GDSL hydrolase family protein [Acetobacteraceae bacterium]
MLDCLVLGDSIAVGVGQARPDCQTIAVSGISSDHFVQMFPGTPQARTAVISLGVNDGDGIATADNLAKLRGRVAADTIYWLVSGTNQHIRDAVRAIAGRFGDRLIDVLPLAGADHIHPDRTGYARLAAETGGTGAGSAASGTRTAYQDFQPQDQVYRAFPGLKVWNGPANLNGVPVRQ